MSELTIRQAVAEDLATLQPLIQRAYRGDSARAGWTHEADLIDDERITMTDLAALIADPRERVLIAFSGEAMIGCVRVADRGDALAYLGLLCVDPVLQTGGIGKYLIEAAERTARDEFDANRMEMTVIERRTELIDYYRRRGYTPTPERRDFPVALDPPLFMTVLEKSLR
jgi:GNAT superfamily N-acetyltransferase